MTQEYRIVIEDDGSAKVIDSKENIVDYETGEWLTRVVRSIYPEACWIYLGQSFTDPDLYKIGVTKDVNRRMKQLNILYIHDIECTGDSVWKLEKAVHSALFAYRVKGKREWFRLNPREYDFVKGFKRLETDIKLYQWTQLLTQSSNEDPEFYIPEIERLQALKRLVEGGE